MIFEMVTCSGCKNCEMACSFHHKGEFAPSKAAIRILEREDMSGFPVSLVEESDGDNLACIGCRECVKHCHAGEDLEKLIVEFMKTRKRGGSVSS
jgi:Fe-S oxidoreductase